MDRGGQAPREMSKRKKGVADDCMTVEEDALPMKRLNAMKSKITFSRSGTTTHQPSQQSEFWNMNVNVVRYQSSWCKAPGNSECTDSRSSALDQINGYDGWSRRREAAPEGRWPTGRTSNGYRLLWLYRPWEIPLNPTKSHQTLLNPTKPAMFFDKLHFFWQVTTISELFWPIPTQTNPSDPYWPIYGNNI